MDAVPVAEMYSGLLHDYSISTVRSVNIKPPVKPSELISHVLLMQPPPGCCMDCSSMNPFPFIFFFLVVFYEVLLFYGPVVSEPILSLQVSLD